MTSTLSAPPAPPPGKSTLGLQSAAWLLWLVWAGLLFGGFFLGPLSASGRSQIPSWCRIGSSVVLVVAGVVWATVAFRTRLRAYGVLLAIGMFFGFLGDLSNGGYLGIAEPTIGGIVFFGVGHLAYKIGRAHV